MRCNLEKFIFVVMLILVVTQGFAGDFPEETPKADGAPCVLRQKGAVEEDDVWLQVKADTGSTMTISGDLPLQIQIEFSEDSYITSTTRLMVGTLAFPPSAMSPDPSLGIYTGIPPVYEPRRDIWILNFPPIRQNGRAELQMDAYDLADNPVSKDEPFIFDIVTSKPQPLVYDSLPPAPEPNREPSPVIWGGREIDTSLTSASLENFLDAEGRVRPDAPFMHTAPSDAYLKGQVRSRRRVVVKQQKLFQNLSPIPRSL